MLARCTKFLLTILALVASTGIILGQELSTGTIEGWVRVESGAPVAQALITAAGPQAPRTALTNADGRYVLLGLPPGDYEVRAQAVGLSTLIQSDVKVYLNRRTQLDFVLSATLTEEVTVVSQAPLFDMKGTTTGASIKLSEFAPYVPLGRNLVSLFSVAPGVCDGGAVMGGTNPSISGSSGLENAYFVDGINLTNSGYGALGAYSIVYGSLGTGVTYGFVEEVQVKTGGFEADYGQAGGGVINTVVRSGTNRFALGLSWLETPGELQGDARDRILSPNRHTLVEGRGRHLSLKLSGPVVKDRLFYFAAYNPVISEQDYKLVSGDGSVAYDLDGDGTADDFFDVGDTITGGRTPSTVTSGRTVENYAAKISWFATANHKLELTAFGDPSEGDVGPQRPTIFLRNLTDPSRVPDPDASASGLDWGGDQFSLKYQGVWSPSFFTEVQYAHKKNEFLETGPGAENRSFFDVEANSTLGGLGFVETCRDESEQWTFKNTHVVGPLELSYGFQREEISWAQPASYSGSIYTAYFPNLVETPEGIGFAAGCTDGAIDDPACYTTLQSATGALVDFFASRASGRYSVVRARFGGRTDPTTAEETNLFVQTTWEIVPSLTLKAGARWTEQELTGAGSYTLPIGTLSNGQVVGGVETTLTAQSYKFESELVPRVGLAWDVRNDGRHKLYANYAEYTQRVPSDLAVRQFSNEVGTNTETFEDAGLTVPTMNVLCNVDSDGDGIFDGVVACHVPEAIGLQGGGSMILDGTQHDPDSEVHHELGPLVDLTTSAATRLPSVEESLFGYAWEIDDQTSFEARYIHRELGRVLEDVQFASNEQTWNLFFGESGWQFLGPAFGDPFPGHGAGAFGSYVLANVGGNVSTEAFSPAERDYDALELIYNRRFHDGWLAYANYRLAKLEGNYEGTYRNDNGQSDPFLTSLFDFPAASAVDTDGDGGFDTFVESPTMIGQYSSGPLNTERRHIFNVFVGKQFDFGLNLGGRLNVQSGQPRGPLFAHPVYENAGEVPGFAPEYWYAVLADVDGDGGPDGVGFWRHPSSTAPYPAGDTGTDFDGNGVADTIVGYGFLWGPLLAGYDPVKRDFLGRTPTQVGLDLSASYDLKLRGGKSHLTFVLNVFNVFDDAEATTFNDNVETRPGAANPNFLRASSYQSPRSVLVGVAFTY